MRVTFDSNTYQRVADPSQFPADPSSAACHAIHAALRRGCIKGFLSETVATLEGIQKTRRGPYFASMEPECDVKEEKLPDGIIKLGIVVKPNDCLHPGLHPILIKWLNSASALGIKFMHAPRIGVPRPSELLRGVYDVEAGENQAAKRQSSFDKLAREIERRGAGIAVVKNIGTQINTRLGLAKPWFVSLDRPKDAQEENRIKKAIAEWADGDTVAAHYAYDNEYLCSEDIGQSAGTHTIFDATNRTWLETAYGLKFITLSELSAKL